MGRGGIEYEQRATTGYRKSSKLLEKHQNVCACSRIKLEKLMKGEIHKKKKYK